MSDIIKSLNLNSIPFKTDMPSTHLSAYRGGGKTSLIAYPESINALTRLIEVAEGEGMPYMPIGNGSNVLIKDGGYDGIMISAIGFREIVPKGNKLLCGGGAGLSNAMRAAESVSLAGLEELSGIPGTVGGAVYMNAGAFGREISELIDSVTVFDFKTRKVRTLTKEELSFSYRSSGSAFFGSLIIETTLELVDGENLSEKAREYRDKRRALQPSAPSLGSTFRKTPDGVSAGYYIDKAGLKGVRVGGAEISRKHANFIINRGGGSAKDYLDLVGLAASVVEKKYNITLETEIITVGKEQSD